MSLVLIKIKTSSTYRAPKGNEKKQSKTQISKNTSISSCLLGSKGGKAGHTSPSPGVTAPGPTKVRIKKKMSDERSIFPVARFNGIKTSPTGVSGCMGE